MDKVLLGIIVLISLLAFNNQKLFNKLSFRPVEIQKGQWYRFISHVFIHSGIIHLFFNGFVFYSFAPHVLQWLGYLHPGSSLTLFALLFIGGAIAGVIPTYFREKNNPYYTAVGASGGVSALVFSIVLISPTSTLLVFFVPMPAYLFGVLYLAYEYYMAKRNSQDKIAHDVHLVSALFGLLCTYLIHPPVLKQFIEAVF